MMMAGYRIAQQIRDTDPFKSLISEQYLPGPEVKTDDDFKQYIRNNASTVYHPCGTNRMGSDERSGVDPELRVRGVSGLRVVDASVFPLVPSSNIHPAVLMLAERAAEMVRKAA